MTELSDSIIQLHNEGLSYRQIQAQLNCSKGTIAYHLGEGQKAKSRERARDRRGKVVKYIQSIKQNAFCADCKEDYPYWIMEFDHLGDKLFNISNAVRNYSFEQIVVEISKCEVVCANCHKDRTYIRLINNGSNALDVSDFY